MQSTPSSNQFDTLGDKLEKNVYGSLKGKLRLHLLQRDIEDVYPDFSRKSLSVLDIGGGGGQFAQICIMKGHTLLMLDSSKRMVEEATDRLSKEIYEGRLTINHCDFLSDHDLISEYDLVALHGAAEWMGDPESAIEKAIGLVRPGGLLSLMVFNSNRHLLKRGISGQLLENEVSTKQSNLTPPGARSAEELCQLMEEVKGGKVLLQSGIRIFHGFFRSVMVKDLSFKNWLDQEISYYRQEPFSSLGEHTHILWRATK